MLPSIFTALDTSDFFTAKKFLKELSPELTGIKIGKELFTCIGPKIVELAKFLNYKVFLDLKFHDIPNTVYKACQAVANLGVDLTTIHVQGGPQMLTAAISGVQHSDTKILGVTVLTSLDNIQLKQLGHNKTSEQLVLNYANLAKESKLAGIVCSPLEIRLIRSTIPNPFLIVTPGIREASSAKDDQLRVMSPREAIEQGSNILVIGRPITKAENPAKKLELIFNQLKA